MAFRLKSWSDADDLMPAISRAAADHAWIFVLLIALVSLITVFFIFRFPTRIPKLMIAGLCVQVLVLWCAMFRYFYYGFLGGVSVTHGQEFESDRFMSVAFGVFPVTLGAVLLTLFATLFDLLARKR